MQRREYLLAGSSLATVAVAGCTSGNGNAGNGDGDETNGISPPTLENHDVQQAPGGWDVEVTMSNETESLLNRAIGKVSIYEDNTRLADGRAAVIDLEPGITSTETALLSDFAPEDVTHYTITMSGETEDYEETDTEEFEFDGDEFRNRLSG